MLEVTHKILVNILPEGIIMESESLKDCSPDLEVYTSYTEKPDTWADDWNPDDVHVNWGVLPEE